MPPSAFDDVVESVRSALNAKRNELSQRSAAIEAALRGYERAVEGEIALAFAEAHQLRQPSPVERAADAARKLVRAVASLPELSEIDVPAPSGEKPIRSEPEPARSRPSASAGRLVIIGALSGREKKAALPAELATDAEWIDTERDGVHAVGNLPQRIRQGRVSGVVILDRVVSHKHTEPVVAAARDAKVPIAFAGQGGRASLLRALQQIADMRRQRS